MGIPKHYIPNSLNATNKRKQKKELEKSKKMYKQKKYYSRKKIKSFVSKRSKHVIKAKKMYKVDMIGSNNKLAKATKCSKKGLEKILNKGRGAYYSSGSRPNQTAESWAVARLGSAITGGPSSKVDYHILVKECKKGSKALKLAIKPKKYKYKDNHK
jgi:hypothetical protein